MNIAVPEFPAIIGDEASGVVEAVGPNVTLVKVGDRVAYADAFGAYTTVRLYPEERLTWMCCNFQGCWLVT